MSLEKHEIACNAYSLWMENRKPRFEYYFEVMKQTKAQFKFSKSTHFKIAQTTNSRYVGGD